MTDASDASDDEKNNRRSSRSNRKSSEMSPHPGLRAHRHEQETHLRHLRTYLSEAGLLSTAEGGVPEKVLLLVDVDIDAIPGICTFTSRNVISLL